jgi:hypothetical protein
VPSSPWPAVALVGSYEPLIVIICGAQVPADVPDVAGVPDRVPDADRLQVQAANSPLSSRPVAFPRCAQRVRGLPGYLHQQITAGGPLGRPSPRPTLHRGRPGGSSQDVTH